jgi:Carbohydrate family 9 binding domain-like
MDSWTQQGRRMSGAGIPRIARAVAVAVILTPVAVIAQSSAGASVSIRNNPNPIVATRANPAMRVDGRLDEPIWRFVQPSTNFVQKDPVEGAAATLLTDVRMIITDDAVVIGARLQDDYRAVLSALGPPTDGAAGGYLDDYFEIQIDAHREHLTSFAFNVAPSGNRRAWIVGRDGTRDESWNFHWEAATNVDAKGWTVEVKIPLSEFHVTPGTESWGVQFVRFSWRRQETDVFRSLPNSLLRAASTQVR